MKLSFFYLLLLVRLRLSAFLFSVREGRGLERRDSPHVIAKMIPLPSRSYLSQKESI